MLKYVASTAFCVLALLSACEPNGSESMEPVPESGSTISSGKDQTPHKDDITGLDSSAIQALAEVNNWRQKGCKCGDVSMHATTKDTWNREIYQAAMAHTKTKKANKQI